MTLQERWITSGASRLKARQKRGFAYRAKQKASVAIVSTSVERIRSDGRRQYSKRKRIIVGQTASSLPSTKHAHAPGLGYRTSMSNDEDEHHPNKFLPATETNLKAHQPCFGEIRPPLPASFKSYPVESTKYNLEYQLRTTTSGSQLKKCNKSSDVHGDELIFAEAHATFSTDGGDPSLITGIGFKEGTDQKSANLQLTSQNINMTSRNPVYAGQFELKTNTFPGFPVHGSQMSDTLTMTPALCRGKEEPIDHSFDVLSRSAGSVGSYNNNSLLGQSSYEDPQTSFKRPYSQFEIRLDSSKNETPPYFAKRISSALPNADRDLDAQERVTAFHKNPHEEFGQQDKEEGQDQTELAIFSGSLEEKDQMRFFNEGIEVSIDGIPLSQKPGNDPAYHIARQRQENVLEAPATSKRYLNCKEMVSETGIKSRRKRQEELDTLRSYQQSFWKSFALESDEDE